MRSGAEVIHDRLAFAGANWKKLLQLRDAWAVEASTWLNQRNQLKRAYDREMAATQAAAAHVAAAQAASARGDSGTEPPAKKMCVRIAQKAKERTPGSLTVEPGDTCVFIEHATNPLWTVVKMDDDGRRGLVSASRLVEIDEQASIHKCTHAHTHTRHLTCTLIGAG
jgi:plastocyanin